MTKSPSKIESTVSEGDENGRLALFRKLSVFQGLSAETISMLAKACTERFILKGNYVFKEDELGSSLVIFDRGLAVESKRCGETDCVLAYYSSPSILGESCFMDSCPRSTSLFANEDSHVLEIHNRELRYLAENVPTQFEKLYTNMGRELGKKVSYINLKLTQANQNSFERESGISWYRY